MIGPTFIETVQALLPPNVEVEKVVVDYGANTATIWFTVPVVVQAVKKEKKCPK